MRGAVIVLLIISIFLFTVAGVVDMRGKTGIEYDGKIRMSKQHMWSDGLFLLVLSCWLMIYGTSGVVLKALR